MRTSDIPTKSNPLLEFFNSRTQGQGIWKWEHYFDIYDRHLKRFRGTDVHILEIGVYSGGSLEMWDHYFGPDAHVFGVDIQPDCQVYERNNIRIFIGDQADRNFWKEFRHAVPTLDIVIDDGGHEPNQQRVSLEELLPHLRAGGVYLCEDVHGSKNEFATYVHRLAQKLNDCSDFSSNVDDNDRRLVAKTTRFQRFVNSVHLYPYVMVIEKNTVPLSELRAPKRGTLWQPYLE